MYREFIRNRRREDYCYKRNQASLMNVSWLVAMAIPHPRLLYSRFSDELEQDTHQRIQDSFEKYFPNFNQPFEEVIYPRGDIDAVSITKTDVSLLQAGRYISDTIIDFYIKYLKNRIKAEERHRFHFFNCFFFQKLADPGKHPLHGSQGRAAFERVRKWTRNMNLFEKDYVFIPVNYNRHWSLIVLCHLGEVATYKDEDVTKLSKVPCILHMDSLRGNHTGLKDLILSYLEEEWRERVHKTSEDLSSRFENLPFISLELPQQQNDFDCGLFLLHYVELFLMQTPVEFNPYKIPHTVGFLNAKWFPPAEASDKRVAIQRLISNLRQQPHMPEICSPSLATASGKSSIQKPREMIIFSDIYNPPSSSTSGCEVELRQLRGVPKAPLATVEEDVEMAEASESDSDMQKQEHPTKRMRLG